MPDHQMAAMGGSIGLADDDVGMESWISIIKNNVPDEGENLNLLSNGDPVEGLLRPIEVTQRDIGKGPNRGEVTRLDLFFACKGEQTLYHFVSFVKNDCVRFFSHLVDQLCFHGDLMIDSL